MSSHHLKSSWGESALDSPFPVFCHPFVLAVHLWMVTQLPDFPQAVATHVGLILMVEVVMTLTHFVSIAHNVVVMCQWAGCSLEVVSWVVEQEHRTMVGDLLKTTEDH